MGESVDEDREFGAVLAAIVLVMWISFHCSILPILLDALA
jgi:hypothetical protein